MVGVILKKSVRNLGKIGDVVNVAAGYARNYLIPQGLVVYGSKANMLSLEKERISIEEILQKELKEAEAKKIEVEAVETIVIYTAVGEEGKLFGSVTIKDVIKSLVDRGVHLDRKSISFEPIRQIGDYDIDVHLHPKISCKLKVSIVKK